MDQASTPNNKSSWLFTPNNANAPVAVTDMVGGANLPAAANEIGVFAQRCPNHLFVQLWGESGVTYKLLIAGVQQNTDDSYEVVDLLEADVTCRTGAGSKNVLGDVLYPAMTHSIVRNAVNFKVLDGDAGSKCSGGLLVDTLGFIPVALRVNCAAGPKKANLALRSM